MRPIVLNGPANKGVPRPSSPGEALVVDLPKVPRRRLDEYATTAGEVS